MTKSFLTPIKIANISSDPTGSTGALYYNTALNSLKYYNGSSWQTLGTASTSLIWIYLASTSVTTVSGTDINSQTLVYTVGSELVYLNGVLQVRGTDYTATTGTSIVFASAISVGDYVEVVANASTTIIQPTLAPLASPTFTGTVTIPLLTVNGINASGTSILTSGSGQKGGATYHDIIQSTNTYASATNPNKFIRINATGGLEVVNSAYTSVIFTISDSGVLSVPSISNPVITGTLNAGGSVGTSGQYLQSTGTGVQWVTGATSGVSSFSAGTTGLTPATATTGAITLAGTLVVANGGTGTGTAGITAFNNITGYTATGATGTTSTNLVFSTSPTLTTPKIDSIVTNTGAAAAATLFGDVTTGSITIGSTLGSTAAVGTISLANNAGITGGTKVINIGTGATAGTTTITIGSATGSTTNILGTAQVGGNAILTSASTINATTLNSQAASYYADHIIPYTKTGTLAVTTGTIRYRLPYAATIIGVTAAVNTPPTGAAIIVDVVKWTSPTFSGAGTTIFSTTANRPTIAIGGYATTTAPTPNTTALAAGDMLAVNIAQVGSGTAGSDLSVFIEIQRA